MRDAVPDETGEIIRLQPFVVPHFHGVGPACGQGGQELVEVGNEVAAMLIVAGIKSGKLEHQQTDLSAERFAGFEERILK